VAPATDQRHTAPAETPAYSPESNHEGVPPPSDSTGPVLEDAASILEFLAWGRRKNSEYAADSPTDVRDAETTSSFLTPVEGASPIAALQLLLPGAKQLSQLVAYHGDCLLWFHCSYYAPAFQRQLRDFQQRCQGRVDHPGVNLQWLALLFAVIAGSIVCTPDSVARTWGFRPRERDTLSKRWFRAVYTCLGAAEYAANQSLFSVQAISTLTISAHLLGFSNIHSVHLAAAIRIAQGLGLHRIAEESPGAVVDKECGRRLWSQLCCQDWFSIPFSDTYLINPLHSRSDMPLNCHDEDMQPLPTSMPTITSYSRILVRIASIMPQLQDDLVSCNTPFTKYEQVLKWDQEMRALSTAERPSFLSNHPIDPYWPIYVPWARRALAISSAHKIIMIHRSFLSESFTNPAFSFTRRICLAASKTIIKEFKSAMHENDPKFWTHQAFSVAACINLLLDMMHRSPTESDYNEHKLLVEDTVSLLQQCQNSMIATRGTKLLSTLLKEVVQSDQTHDNSRKRRHDGSRAFVAESRAFSVPKFVKSFCDGQSTTAAASTSQHNAESLPFTDTNILSSATADSQPYTIGPLDLYTSEDPRNDMSNLFPAFEGATPFDNLLYLANHDFT
jgi:hypothetical protein